MPQHACPSAQVGPGGPSACKLAELDHSAAYLGVVSVFVCDAATDVAQTYSAHQDTIARVSEASAGIPVLAARLFGSGPEAAVVACRAAVRKDKTMEGLVAMEEHEMQVCALFRLCVLHCRCKSALACSHNVMHNMHLICSAAIAYMQQQQSMMDKHSDKVGTRVC